MQTQTKQSGFTLLEILVTLLIVSFSLLGIAGIIANSLKANHSAYARSQASWMANDIIDSMRANGTTAESTNPSPYNLAVGDTPTGSGVVLADLTRWRAALAATLPAGTGSVDIDAASSRVTVTVQWNDSRATGGDAAQEFIVETRL